jgi:hypothetical protein
MDASLHVNLLWKPQCLWSKRVDSSECTQEVELYCNRIFRRSGSAPPDSRLQQVASVLAQLEFRCNLILLKEALTDRTKEEHERQKELIPVQETLMRVLASDRVLARRIYLPPQIEF